MPISWLPSLILQTCFQDVFIFMAPGIYGLDRPFRFHSLEINRKQRGFIFHNWTVPRSPAAPVLG